MSNYINRDSKFWVQYVRGRPVVPPSFFASIFAYHKSHNGTFELLHEAGAGPGVHTPRLVTEFTKAIVSDVYSETVQVATSHCQQRTNCSFRVHRLEDPLPEDGQVLVDMLVTINMLHLCDFDAAIASVHRQLKPNGTFVYVFFAWPAFPENETAQNVLESMCRRGVTWLRDVKGRDLKTVGRFVSKGDQISSKGFRDVVRQRINFPKRFEWRNMVHAEGQIYEPWETAREDEVVKLDDKGWDFEVDVKGLRENLSSHPWGNESGLLDDLWAEMEEIMGEKKINAVWPVTCVFATKE